MFQLSGSELEHVGPMSLLRTFRLYGEVLRAHIMPFVKIITGCVPWCWRTDLAANSAFCSCRVPEWLTTACNSNCKRIYHPLLVSMRTELTCVYPLEDAHAYT